MTHPPGRAKHTMLTHPPDQAGVTLEMGLHMAGKAGGTSVMGLRMAGRSTSPFQNTLDGLPKTCM